MEVAAIRKERGVLRANFTKFATKFEETMKSNEDPVVLEGEFEVLTSKFELLRASEERTFQALLADDTTEEEMAEDFDSSDKYLSKFSLLKSKFFDMKKTTRNEDSISSSGVNPKRKFKLPLVEFKKFSGDVREWLPFWNQFKKIDQDEDIDPSDKIHYLYQATVPNSPARRIVESFPAVDANYEKIIGILKSRYGRDDLQIEVYVRELLRLIIKNSGFKGRINIADLYDTLETQLRSLETLGITTDKCTAMLFPLVESCLPEELLRIWQRSQKGELGIISDSQEQKDLLGSVSDVNHSSKPQNRLDRLLMFLKNEVENEQRISLAAEGLGLTPVSTPRRDKGCHKSSESIPTASGLDNYEPTKCIFCSGSHPSQNCYKAQRMTLSKRKEVLTSAKACFKCLKVGHIVRRCKDSQIKCLRCKGSQVTLMCPDLDESKEKPIKEERPKGSVGMANYTRDFVFLQTLKVRVSGPSGFKVVRALIDRASQHSYISKQVVRELSLRVTSHEKVIHSLFGGIDTNVKEHKVYKFTISGVHENNSKRFEMMDIDKICSSISPVFDGVWTKELKELGIEITDVDPGPIDILFGADVCATLDTGQKHLLTCGIAVQKTIFGWTLIGRVKNFCAENSSLSALTFSLLRNDISRLWDIDVLGIKEPVNNKNSSESAVDAREFFSQTVSIDEEGRYSVRLPWLEGHPPLPSNFDLARRRLESTLVRIKEKHLFNDYESVLKEWLDEGIIEDVTGLGSMETQVHYLPHRPVIKESSTTRIRPVFDASAHGKDQPCLNDCLEKGVNLIERIPNILCRFRTHRIGVVADIRKAFLQISVHPSDRDFLRFLWLKSDNDLRIFRHKRVVFGINCSPFLLESTIQHHLKQLLERSPQLKSTYSIESIAILLKGFYVDNCVASLEDKDKAQKFVSEATEIMSEAKFELRGWELSDELLLFRSLFLY